MSSSFGSFGSMSDDSMNPRDTAVLGKDPDPTELDCVPFALLFAWWQIPMLTDMSVDSPNWILWGLAVLPLLLLWALPYVYRFWPHTFMPMSVWVLGRAVSFIYRGGGTTSIVFLSNLLSKYAAWTTVLWYTLHVMCVVFPSHHLVSRSSQFILSMVTRIASPIMVIVIRFVYMFLRFIVHVCNWMIDLISARILVPCARMIQVISERISVPCARMMTEIERVSTEVMNTVLPVARAGWFVLHKIGSTVFTTIWRIIGPVTRVIVDRCTMCCDRLGERFITRFIVCCNAIERAIGRLSVCTQFLSRRCTMAFRALCCIKWAHCIAFQSWFVRTRIALFFMSLCFARRIWLRRKVLASKNIGYIAKADDGRGGESKAVSEENKELYAVALQTTTHVPWLIPDDRESGVVSRAAAFVIVDNIVDNTGTGKQSALISPHTVHLYTIYNYSDSLCNCHIRWGGISTNKQGGTTCTTGGDGGEGGTDMSCVITEVVQLDRWSHATCVVPPRATMIFSDLCVRFVPVLLENDFKHGIGSEMGSEPDAQRLREYMASDRFRVLPLWARSMHLSPERKTEQKRKNYDGGVNDKKTKDDQERKKYDGNDEFTKHGYAGVEIVDQSIYLRYALSPIRAK